MSETPDEDPAPASAEAKSKEKKGKDFWDKTSTISGVFSSVLIAGFGLYFNQTTQEGQQKLDELIATQRNAIAVEQTRLQELQVIESLLPHLAGGDTSEDSKKLALTALRHLGNPKLATEFAELLGGEGARQALTQISRTANSDEERALAEAALQRMTLSVSGNEMEATAEQLVSQIERMTEGLEEFLILRVDEEVYMQTAGGPDYFTLEYREGSSDKHFHCEVDRAMLIAALNAYARAGDESWRTICAWKKLDL